MRSASPAILMAVFFLALAPLLASTTHSHSDEPLYSDAVLRMIDSGNYLMPRFADGSPRFQKPLLTYWFMAGSARLFGVNQTALRFPALLAGALLILVTYRLARVLFDDDRIAAIAAMAAAANAELMQGALRATPDILLALFLTLSLYGFARLILRGEGTRGAHLAAYGGAGLAVATKGLSGLAPVIYAFVFLWIMPRLGARPSARPRSLLSPVAMAAGAAISIAGFLPFLSGGGGAGEAALAWRTFLHDQVGGRLAESAGRVLDNAATYASFPLRSFFPFTLLLLPLVFVDRAAAVRWLRRHATASCFAAGWYAASFLLFAGANITRSRYLLPTVPWLAALLAGVLTASGAARFAARARHPLYALALLPGFLLLAAGARLDARILIAGAIWVTVVTALFVLAARQRGLVAWSAVALFVLMGYSVFESLVRPVFKVSPAPALAARLQELDPTGARPAAIDLSEKYAGQIRVATGGRVWPRDLPPHATPEDARGEEVVVMKLAPEGDRERNAAAWREAGWRVEEVAFSYENWSGGDIWQAIRAGGGTEREAVFHRMRNPYAVAVRETTAPPAR